MHDTVNGVKKLDSLQREKCELKIRQEKLSKLKCRERNMKGERNRGMISLNNIEWYNICEIRIPEEEKK